METQNNTDKHVGFVQTCQSAMKIGMVLGGIMVGTLASCITGFLVANVRENTVNECAQRAAMTHYEPVGNGGALAAWYEKRSPERQEMYKRMQRAYEEVAGKDNLNTLEYDTLKFYAEGREH